MTTNKKKFTRRYYRRFADVKVDFRYIIRHRKLIRRAMRELISHDFRERLMMVVTEVNGCRYCSYYHVREAAKSGVSEDELAVLLQGHIPENTPTDEYAALIYAQHWAENDAKPEIEALQRLVDIYGQEIVDAIHIVLRMIRMGNLSGNLLDYWLFKLSFGRYGLHENEERFAILK